MKVDGGKANPERTWLILSIIGMLIGVILALVSWLNIQGSVVDSWTDDYQAMGLFGLVLTVASAAVFIVMSLRRYFRYWLVRLIFEQREQTDRLLSK